MSALANPRHEAFANELARGISAAQAYQNVGYVANRHNASALSRTKPIANRVSQLIADVDKVARQSAEIAAKRMSIDREWVMRSLMSDRLTALELKQPAPAIRALELLGKELAMFVDRKEIRTGSILDDADRETVTQLRLLLLEDMSERQLEDPGQPAIEGETGSEDERDTERNIE